MVNKIVVNISFAILFFIAFALVTVIILNFPINIEVYCPDNKIKYMYGTSNLLERIMNGDYPEVDNVMVFDYENQIYKRTGFTDARFDRECDYYWFKRR